jgi:hypothetical protein
MVKHHKKLKNKLSFSERKELIKSTADELIKQLKRSGFIIQRYDSYSTNSVYLKLDYGVCNSIRISDHQGKKHLSYRYSFLTEGIPEHIPYYCDQTKEGWKRHYYQVDSIDTFMEQLKSDYLRKYNSLGPAGYRNQMIQYRNEGRTKKGFWQQAVIV